MDSAGYTSLTRMVGLNREMQAIANNIANVSTTGFRKEGLIFSEYISALETGEDSLSMAEGNVRLTNDSQGPLTPTGGAYDFAIEGDGFFMIDTPDGQALTRAGAFTTNDQGELTTHDGYRLLDNGGAPIFIPPDAGTVAVSSDGTLSADGLPLSQIGLYMPEDPNTLTRTNGVRFMTTGAIIPQENAVILQGYVENSNVNAITEVARMIEVQHAYTMGQKFMEQEHERIQSVISTLGR
ncbi:flagellar hook-basal body complex protein [Celeribacter baekdonensis]|uniref:Flagellar basal-body rod protein FlgF n=1 Tax=Celeribacter baekdonensis TaxID=875171 RepID=A0A2R4M6B7_9RHOB|nr:flagellar hook-basal body complex protein [Celeribacter baekdonensis]AVW92715.1 flagellar basal-body rod protein FlgF [Celeribacter baekdonensis]|tara:strand:- start:35242 stop:35958 length:717 start_codon:yes stop_codon:yes gene_type:complete